jgi:DNA-binding transcriptional ArsR family regulator
VFASEHLNNNTPIHVIQALLGHASPDTVMVYAKLYPATPFVLPATPAEPDLIAKYFRGLGDATRVRILELLDAEGELTVGELVSGVGESQPKVSNHLACLRWCGFVEGRRDGRLVRYRIADARVSELLSLGRALLADNAEHVAACRRIGGC